MYDRWSCHERYCIFAVWEISISVHVCFLIEPHQYAECSWGYNSLTKYLSSHHSALWQCARLLNLSNSQLLVDFKSLIENTPAPFMQVSPILTKIWFSWMDGVSYYFNQLPYEWIHVCAVEAIKSSPPSTPTSKFGRDDEIDELDDLQFPSPPITTPPPVHELENSKMGKSAPFVILSDTHIASRTNFDSLFSSHWRYRWNRATYIAWKDVRTSLFRLIWETEIVTDWKHFLPHFSLNLEQEEKKSLE